MRCNVRALAGVILGTCMSMLPCRATATPDLPTTRLRIRIAESSVYELAPADLAAAGVPVQEPSFDPGTLRLYFDRWKQAPLLPDSLPASWQDGYAMDEVPLWMPGAEDGRLDEADRVVFYALGPAGWDDLAGASRDSLAYSTHPYDAFNYGWLVWGGAPGLRMEARSVAAPAPLGDPLVTQIGHRDHREEDRVFVTYGDLWAWAVVHTASTTQVAFDLDLGPDSTATGYFRVQLGASNGMSSGVEVRLNDVLLGVSPTFIQDQTLRVGFDGAPLRAHNVLALHPTGSSSTGGLMLVDLDATWSRPLAADAQGELAWSARPATDRNVYELQGFGSAAPLVLDVTDARHPVRLIDPTPTESGDRWRVREERGAGARLHYLAVVAPRRLDPQADLEMRDVVPLRSVTSNPDMLIITHPDLLPAAERLAAHRRSHFPNAASGEVLVTTTHDIYDNFSGGRQDPLAIRNWVKFLWNRAAEPRLAYLLLFGDGTHDPRRVLAESQPTLVPAVHPQYADPRSKRAYPVEDWFVALHDPPAAARFAPQADVSIGRLPARDLAEADRMVDRIIEYETGTSFGAWRGRVLMAADDECNPSAGCREAYFTEDAEQLVAGLPPALDVAKIYETEYPLVDHQKPAARAALIKAWSEGCALLSYQGRGGTSQLADEVFFLSTDVPTLSNATRLPLVLAYHNNGAQFDRTTSQSYMELALSAPSGGAIAAIGATMATYLGSDQALTRRQFEMLFPGGAVTQRPLGLVHRLAKGTPNAYNDGFVLLGDPALVLKIPQLEVSFTSGAESLVVGQRVHIEGVVHASGSSAPLAEFDGRAAVEVRSDADTSGYRRTEPPALEIHYALPGPALYRGEVDVHAGRFAVEFTVPKELGSKLAGADLAAASPGGRIAAYAWGGGADAKGGRDGVVFVHGAPSDSSFGPPRIRLSFAGTATRVTPGDTLTAQLADENGIWIAGVSAASSIWLQWDDGERLDVTAAYHATAGTDTTGVVAVPLPALPAGKHRATLSAADNLGASATVSLEFEFVESLVLEVSSFSVAPNPTRSGSAFTFVLDTPAEVELRIFTVDGRRVCHTQLHHDGLCRGLLRWNGTGAGGRPVASGIYLYELGISPAGAPHRSFTGKIAVLR